MPISKHYRSPRTPLILAARSLLQPATHDRRGFTLVEILVVISIIGVLSAVAIPAVMRALTTAKEAAIRLEIDIIDQALEAYKLDHGEYPPDFSDWKAVERHFRKAFPDIDDNELKLIAQFTHLNDDFERVPVTGNLDPRGSASYTHYRQCIDPAEAIVFCLGGYSSDKRKPFTGPGGPLAPIAMPSTGVTADYGQVQWNSERDNAFADFSPEKLSVVIANDPTDSSSPNPCSATSVYSYSSDEYVSTVAAPGGSTPPVQSAFSNRAPLSTIHFLVDPFPVYTIGDDVKPLVYFNSKTYGQTFVPPAVTGGWVTSTNLWHGLNVFLHPDNDSELGVSRPYVSEQLNTNAGGFYWAEDTRFQLISPGLDGSYGGNVLAGVGAASGAAFQFASGKAFTFGGTLSTSDKYADSGFGADKPQLDNITNFSTRTLESDLP
ncbi:MAG: prepilin-type N-terminal cleavage/methylation domain-containing protein [Planctomycetota bacterium]